MAPTEDWGFEINNTLFQRSTGYCITAGPEGFGSFEHRVFEQERGGYPGDVAGVEVVAARTLIFPLVVHAGEPGQVRDTQRTLAAEAGRLVRPLARAFAPPALFTGADTTLDVLVPGAEPTDEILRFYGRGRGLEVSWETALWSGHVPVLAQFRCTDPYGYGPEEDDSFGSANNPAVVTNIGDVPTDRFTIELISNGSAPTFTSGTDDGATISFNQNIAPATVVVLDFHDHTVTINGGDAYDALSPGPEWFRLLPGANSITHSGLAAFTITWRPAYL